MHTRAIQRRRSRGFTLVELTLSMVLVAITAVGLFPMLHVAVRTYAIAAARNRTVHDVQHAMIQMEREILTVAPAEILATAPTQFQFIDNVGAATSFTLANGTLMRGNNLLAPSITNLAFTYYDQNNVATNVAANVRRVQIALTAQSPGQGSFTMRTEVFPRQFLYNNFQ